MTSDFRSQIKPFPRVAHYATGWAGCRTFDEIYADLTPNLNRLLRYYGNADIDTPDLVAHAFMRLWMDLSADLNLLAHVDKGGALKLLLNRTNPQIFRKVYRHEVYLDDLATRSGDPDEFVIDGFDHGHSNRHAAFAEAVDLRIDIERAIGETAEKYIDSLPHLAALYYITTEVGPDDAAAIAGKGGTKKCCSHRRKQPGRIAIVPALKRHFCVWLIATKPTAICAWWQRFKAWRLMRAARS